MDQPGEEIIISVFGITDIGVVRSQNQDSYLVADLSTSVLSSELSTRRLIVDTKSVIEQRVSSDGSLLVVADGMGGAAAGDIASQLGVDTLLAELTKSMKNGKRKHLSIPDLLKLSVERANMRLWEESQMNIDYRGMGTTLTAALVYNDVAYIAEVGDSRAYLVRNNHIEQVTKDQSAVQMLIDFGRITKEQAATAPNRNIILQALGVEPSVQVALTKLSLRRGDHLLLCSDGLSNKISDEELRDMVLGESAIDKACKNLVELANLRGGEDNITVVLGKIDGERLPVASDEEPIWKTIEIISSFFPNEGRRGLATSQFPTLRLDERRKELQMLRDLGALDDDDDN